MTETLNSHRRALMERARKFAKQAQDPHGPLLIRGDLIGLCWEDLVDLAIEVLRVCPVEVMQVPKSSDVTPCRGCEKNIPVTANGRLYCSEACRNRVKSQNLMDRRAAA
jgi:ECL1/2/3 zinc binding proteins